MPSPFPGMDPYVERHWRTFHGLMIGAITSALNSSLPGGLLARMEEEVRVETLAGERLRGFSPDVTVVAPREFESTSGTTGAAVAEPILLTYRRGPIVLRRVQIVDPQSSGKVITAVELLSPWNKLAGRLNRDYRRKLRQYEDGDTNWVEIDLLRGSRNRLAITWDDVPPRHRSTYLALSYRACRDKAVAYPVSIRDALPTIGVPLREGEADVALNLQAAFERAFADGLFRAVDYGEPLDPPLPDADAAWAAELVARRTGGGG